MEQPVFPLAPGRYVVTGGRQYTLILTVHPNGPLWGRATNRTIKC
jgi:hypothetical protein